MVERINRRHKFNVLCAAQWESGIADNIDEETKEEIMEAYIEAYPDELVESCLGYGVESQFTTSLIGAVFARRAEDILELQRFVRHCLWDSIKSMVQNVMDETAEMEDDTPIDNDNMMRGAT